MLRNLLLAGLCIGLSLPLYGQVAGSARGPADQWYAGAEYSRLNPDYWTFPTEFMNGLSVYGGHTVFLRPHHGIGIEGTWRRLLDESTRREDSFLASARYIFRYHRFAPFVKGGGGFGHFRSGDSSQPNTFPGQDGFHLVGAVGAGIDVRMTSRIYIRPLEWEQQVWSFSPNLLAPHSYNFGASYRFR